MLWSVVIVSWNVRADLEECLNSLQKISFEIPLNVIIVDNGSVDGSILLENKFTNFRWILNKNNRGFAGANNQAREFINTPYVLFLNPDTIITENIFTTLSDFFLTHQKTGIVGPKILNPNGSHQRSIRRFPKVWQILFELMKGANIYPKLLKKYYAFDLRPNKIQLADQVMGSAFAIKKETLDKIGWWDEKYFLWFDEVDLCYRATKAGYEIWYMPTVSLIHKGGASFWQWRALKRQWQFATSASYYFSKNISKFKGRLIWLASPLWFAAGLILSIILLFNFKRKYR